MHMASTSLGDAWRHGGFLTTGICAVFLVQLSLLSLIGMEGMHLLLKAQTSLRVELTESATDQQIQELIAAVDSLPYVRKQTYVTKENVYQQMQKTDPELIAFIEEYQMENPFPETVILELQSPKSAAMLESELRENWQTVVDPAFLSETTQQKQELATFAELVDAGYTVSTRFLYTAIGLLTLILVLLMRQYAVHHRDDMLMDMQMGAERYRVVLPYILQTCVLLLIAGVIGTILAMGVLWIVPGHVSALGAGGALETYATEYLLTLKSFGFTLLGIELVAIPIIASIGVILGSLGSSRA